MKWALAGASRAAILVTLATPLAPACALAQQATGVSEVEEVVVTGSLIRGTAVDAALPVEVYSSE